MATRPATVDAGSIACDDDVRMTTAEAAEFLRISERSLRRLQQTGHLRHFKVGARVQFSLADLRAYVASCEHPAVNA